MKKNELKRLIKPVVKECIHEVLLESGLLTNIVSEVAQGMNQNVIVETKQKRSDALFNEDLQMKRQVKKTNEKLKQHRKKLEQMLITELICLRVQSHCPIEKQHLKAQNLEL